MESKTKNARTTEQLYALRKQAVRQHLKDLPMMQIVAMTEAIKDGLCALESGGGHAVDWPGIRHQTACALSGQVPGALGLHAAEADQKYLRTMPGGGEKMAGRRATILN